jgi:hypothetical protein
MNTDIKELITDEDAIIANFSLDIQNISDAYDTGQIDKDTAKELLNDLKEVLEVEEQASKLETKIKIGKLVRVVISLLKNADLK